MLIRLELAFGSLEELVIGNVEMFNSPLTRFASCQHTKGTSLMN